jgi:tetratricopeptide (TPR) repeat protein
MANENIEKLKEKVSKDPRSKLFVPLADEYRKAGMLDDAVNVLKQGLERQPAYMSAKVALGKIYLEKGMAVEARAEFEQVISSIPDNLYAHKKLAELYRDSGETKKAISEYKALLKLNPLDEDAQKILKELEAAPKEEEEKPVVETTRHGETVSVEEAAVEEAAVEDVAAVEEATAEEAAVEETAEAIEIIGEAELQEEAQPLEETPAEAEEPAHAEEALGEIVVGEIVVEEEADLALTESIEEAINAVPASEEGVYEISELEEAEVAEDVITPLSEEPPVSEGPRQQAEETESNIQVPVGLDLSKADSFLREGDYLKAMKAYRMLLELEPGNRRIMQRVEELRALLKMIGMDKEIKVQGLEAFLDGIRRRRDEFLTRS